eukprot:gene11334-3368_t
MASRSRLRLASCDILWRVMWATLVFIVGILLTSAFVTAHWVETRAISPIPEYRHISLGLIYACFHRFDRDEICGQKWTSRHTSVLLESIGLLLWDWVAVTALGLLIFGASIGEIKHHDNAAIFRPCPGADAFNPGSGCRLGDSGFVALIALGLSFLAASGGLLLDNGEGENMLTRDEREAARRKLSTN